MMIRFIFKKVNSDGSEGDVQEGEGEREDEKPRQVLEMNESSQFFITNFQENSIPQSPAFMEVFVIADLNGL